MYDAIAYEGVPLREHVLDEVAEYQEHVVVDEEEAVDAHHEAYVHHCRQGCQQNANGETLPVAALFEDQVEEEGDEDLGDAGDDEEHGVVELGHALDV